MMHPGNGISFSTKKKAVFLAETDPRVCVPTHTHKRTCTLGTMSSH
jgi:hypothetical protein